MSNPDTDSGWRQVSLWCDDWQAAEQMAVAHLGPRLADAQHAETVTSWWFVRKGASWRVRYLPAASQDEQATAVVTQAMQDLTTDGAVRRWVTTIYEPEIHAFGGVDGITLAHHLFHADSRHLLDHLRRVSHDHRRELGLLLGSALLRGAGQDWYEQGDVWARITAHRSTGHPPPPERAARDVHRLITASLDSPPSPLAAAPDWPAAFHRAGRELAELAHQGGLTRGLRAVLAHHILFAWNRAGISAQQQAVLAATAAWVVFDQERASTPAPTSDIVTVGPTRLTAVTADTTIPDPAQLREGLVDYIRRRRTFQSPQVEAAFSTVLRHLFLPGVDLQTAYAPQVVVTKRAEDGAVLSSASHPNLVASMLEQLDVQPGHRVLEIGAATGINAALLAELVGPTGTVVTIEIDEDLAAGARTALAAAGYDRVEVICADGALGDPAHAPCDRIIATAGSWDLVSAWWQQLTLGGRLVVPLRLHASGLTRSIAFDLHQPDRMISSSAQVCGFVPLRGTAAHAERCVTLAADVALHPDAGDLPDEGALSQALTYPAHEYWTGVVFRDSEPVEHLDLWLATATPGFARLSVGSQARESGLVNPALRWAGATLYDGGTVAYLALRPRGNETNELGLIAHGPGSAQLTARTADLLHQWDRQRPTQPVITAYPAETPDDQLAHGTRIDRADTRLTIAW